MARKGKQKYTGKQKSHAGMKSHDSRAELKKIQHYVERSDLATAFKLAEEFTRLNPSNPHGWEVLADVQAQQQNLESACISMEKAISCVSGKQPQAELKLAKYELFAGEALRAIKRLEEISKKLPSDKRVWAWLSRAYHVIGKGQEALVANDKAFALDHSNPETLLWRSRIFDQLKRHSDAYQTARVLKKISPNTIGVSNHLASLSLREGDYIAAEEHFNDELAISDNAATAYNALIGKHYNPEYTAEALSAFAVAWQANYINNKNITRAATVAKSNKKIRIGLLSNSFRTHPVGQMILPVLEAIDKHELELFFYSTSQTADHLTDAIKATADKWANIAEASDEQLNQIIRQDKIDILIDMNGGGEGSRFTALSKEPAPLMVKWVGMLINTTGLKCFDYLLSDSIETPKGVDHLYTEKLIRLPDDYVCYHLPKYIPDVNGLPALKNGFITFGCLNNPAKLSDPLIKEWSILLKEVPGSKLLLRGIQFESDAFCQKTFARFAQYGIGDERLMLEGPAKHQEFLKTYQRIDIALDTWPYSGGLTTCEALAMGVPVVTCVGPTFAGRHSATHLANAGLPELVTDNWPDFRKRARELAADLPSLAVIRAALRTILRESPVCDGARFSKHFTKAMRAIWQRHCESKTPTALTFNKEGDAWFADESEAVTLLEVETLPESSDSLFEWNLESPITVIDNGALFARHPKFIEWMQTGNFAVITFDPGSLLTNKAEELKELGEWHHYPHATLGDGRDATLYATLDPELTGTLEPKAACQTGEPEDPLRLLSTLPISSVVLDAIEGLPKVDVLVLDDLNKALPILECGKRYLQHSLMIKVRVAFKCTHTGQPEFSTVDSWAKKNGFRFYTLCNLVRKPSAANISLSSSESDELISADAIFIPGANRIEQLSDQDKMKLAFIQNSIQESFKAAHEILCKCSSSLAEQYVGAKGAANVGSEVDARGRINSIQDLMVLLEETKLSQKRANHTMPGHLVVSLTSYSTRFSNLHLTLRSLLLQKMRPDCLVLWIAEGEKSKLPESVLSLKDFGLQIRFCEDIRSYKKIIPTLNEFSDSFIVTADDDVFYTEDWLDGLIRSWDGNEKTIVAHRAHKMLLDKKGAPVSYRKWKWQVEPSEIADGLIVPTGCGGVLYPPGVFHDDVTREELFSSLAPQADDLWLFWMAALNGAKAKRSDFDFKLIEWPNSEKGNNLWQSNVLEGGNDRVVKKLVEFYGLPVPSNDAFYAKSTAFSETEKSVIFFLKNDGFYKGKLGVEKQDLLSRSDFEDISNHLYKKLNDVEKTPLSKDVAFLLDSDFVFADVGCDLFSIIKHLSLLEKKPLFLLRYSFVDSSTLSLREVLTQMSATGFSDSYIVSLQRDKILDGYQKRLRFSEQAKEVMIAFFDNKDMEK